MSRRTRSTLKAELRKEEKSSPSPSVSEPSPAGPTGPAPLLLPDETAWQDWLQSSHRESSGVWLQIAKKNAEKPSVTYEQALEVALCFGWIDGQRKAFDEQHFIQRFTPRRKNSMWSKRNVDKVMMLTQSQRMTPAGQAEVNAAKADGRWDRAYSSASVMEVPVDFEEALKENDEAKKFFDALNKTQRYVFLWRIETTRRPETRKRKIDEFVDLLAEHKLLH
ncbi:hypothetical protein ColLi_13139 [Colletotrichum liriopes]|uniref:Bacteriocin-protection protein n=1 Tax=Colletotrichum liriopes TaxID=708192 RepID=A0AA37GZN2_9PEZI|nr:hypothetical protein ColLi_13139 [Colletotrichum liriopes]